MRQCDNTTIVGVRGFWLRLSQVITGTARQKASEIRSSTHIHTHPYTSVHIRTHQHTSLHLQICVSDGGPRLRRHPLNMYVQSTLISSHEVEAISITRAHNMCLQATFAWFKNITSLGDIGGHNIRTYRTYHKEEHDLYTKMTVLLITRNSHA